MSRRLRCTEEPFFPVSLAYPGQLVSSTFRSIDKSFPTIANISQHKSWLLKPTLHRTLRILIRHCRCLVRTFWPVIIQYMKVSTTLCLVILLKSHDTNFVQRECEGYLNLIVLNHIFDRKLLYSSLSHMDVPFSSTTETLLTSGST